MKKLLTVLLAMAIVCTYSFSAVWAVAPGSATAGDNYLTEAQVLANIDTAYKAALGDVQAQRDTAVATVMGKNANGAVNASKNIKGIDVTKTALISAYDAHYQAMVAAVDAKYAAAKNAVAAATTAGVTNYNGKFYLASAIGTGADETEAAWKAAGYAAYDSTWAAKATYLPSAGYDADSYLAIFAADGTGSGTTAVAQNVYAEVKAAALKAINAIDLSVYSKDYNGAAQSNYDKAAADKAKAITAISGLGTPADWVAATADIAAVNDIYTAPVNNGSATGKLYAGGTVVAPLASVTFVGLNNITKVADLPTEAAKLAWAKNLVLTTMLGNVNTQLAATKTAQSNIILNENLKGSAANATTIANANAKIAAAEADAAAATEIITYAVNNTSDYRNLVTVASPFTSSTIKTGYWSYTNTSADADITNDTYTIFNGASAATSYDMAKSTAVVQHVKDLKDQAELLKKTIGIEGSTTVDVALDDAIDETYYKGNASAAIDYDNTVTNVYNRQQALIGADAKNITVNSKSYPTVEAWDDNLTTNYDKSNYDQVRKVMSDAETAISATKTVADADAAFVAAYAKLAAIPTKATKTANQATPEFQALLAQYKADIAAYANYKAANINASDYSWNKGTMVTNLQDGLSDAYTVDELKTAYTDAKSQIDSLKTKAALQKEAADLMTRVNALPTTATAADKATVAALKKDINTHNDYCDLIGDAANKVQLITKLTNADNAIKTAEAKAIADASDAIWKDGKVTADEAAAVEALNKLYDAYVADYTPANATPTEIANVKALKSADGTTTYATLSKTVPATNAALQTAQVKAVVDQIATIPADGSDVKAIEAALKAYNALSTDAKMELYKNYKTSYDKLIDLQKVLVKDAQALKITAASKAYKGIITWKVKGSVVTGVKYQVMRSLHKNYGFKYMKTTSTQKYVNTKNLKKGKVYYYKVRAFVTINGVKYYSDWSNKAFRTAK